jgi:GNAT superfamily N-acetyltransferase
MKTSPARTDKPKAAPLELRALRRNDWKIVLALFGDNGACGGCWCMWWRVERGGKLWEENKGRKNKAALRKLIEGGKAYGILAFSDGKPVGWCSVGPRQDYPRLHRSRPFQVDSPDGTWSVTCFYIPSKWRGKGVATALLKEAESLARRKGARALEGYPVKPTGKAALVPPAFAWTGLPRLFERARFPNITKHKDSRNVYRKRFNR